MAVTIEIPYHTIWNFDQKRSAVFAYFSKLETALTAHFPGLDRVKPLGNDVYLWEFEPLEYSGYKLDFRFNTQFKTKPEESIEAVPTSGGMGKLACTWTFKETHGCQVEFRAKLAVDLPVPGLLKSMVSGVATKEITKLFERYSASVTQKFKT